MCEASPQSNSLFYIQHSFVSLYLERVKRDRWATRNSLLLLFFFTFKFPSYVVKAVHTRGQNFNISFVALLLPWKIPATLSTGYFTDP